MVLEPGLVVVDAYVTAVDGDQSRFSSKVICRVGRGDRCVRNDALPNNARRYGVVEAEYRVSQRGILREDELVGELATVANRLDLDGDPGLFAELVEEFLREIEGIVGKNRDRLFTA